MQDRPVQCFVGSYYAQQNLQLIPREKMPQLHPLQEKHKAILLEGLDGIIPRYLQEKIWNMIWKRWLYYEDFCKSEMKEDKTRKKNLAYLIYYEKRQAIFI